jgi:hypothetical protein
MLWPDRLRSSVTGKAEAGSAGEQPVEENFSASGLGQMPRLRVNALALPARRYPCVNLAGFPPRFPPTPRVVLLRIGSFRGCPERSIADIVEPPLGFGVGLVSLSP